MSAEIFTFPARKPQLPALVPKKRSETEAVILIARNANYLALSLLQTEDPEAFKALPKGIQRKKILHRALELLQKAGTHQQQAIINELVQQGKVPELTPPENPSSTYSA